MNWSGNVCKCMLWLDTDINGRTNNDCTNNDRTKDVVPSVNRKDLQVFGLVGPPRDNPEIDPLAVIHLGN